MGQNVQQNTTSTTPATPSGGGVQTISLPGNSGNNPGIIMVSMAEKILTINTQSHMVQIVIQICDIGITALTMSVESDSSISCSE